MSVGDAHKVLIEERLYLDVGGRVWKHAQGQVDLAIGTTNSGVALAMLPVAEPLRKVVVMLSPRYSVASTRAGDRRTAVTSRTLWAGTELAGAAATGASENAPEQPVGLIWQLKLDSVPTSKAWPPLTGPNTYTPWPEYARILPVCGYWR